VAKEYQGNRGGVKWDSQNVNAMQKLPVLCHAKISGFTID